MKKKLFLIIGIIVAIIVGVIAYFVVDGLKQEELLQKEIVNLTNKNILTGNFDIEIATKGDYAYIEEAIKKYYKELSDNAKVINQYLNDKDLINILSPANLDKDKPNFDASYKILSEAKEKSTEALNNIASLCDEEKIKNLIDKDKVDSYYIDLYKKLMYTDEDIKKFKETKSEMETLSTNLNLFLDKVKEMLDMLKRTNGSWEIKSNQIYFDTNSLVNEYNKLYNELTHIATEKFTEQKNDNSNSSI